MTEETPPPAEENKEPEKSQHELDLEQAKIAQQVRTADFVQLKSEMTAFIPLVQGVAQGKFPYERLKDRLEVRLEKINGLLAKIPLLGDQVKIVENVNYIETNAQYLGSLQDAVRTATVLQQLLPAFGAIQRFMSEDKRQLTASVEAELAGNFVKVKELIPVLLAHMEERPSESLETQLQQIAAEQHILVLNQVRNVHQLHKALFQDILVLFPDFQQYQQKIEDDNKIIDEINTRIEQIKLMRRVNKKLYN